MALNDSNDFDTNDLSTRIRLNFSPLQKARLLKLKEDLGLSSTRELLIFLVKFMELEDADSIALFRLSLNTRLKRGVGSSFIIQLKLLYTLIGIFLKRVNSL